MANPFVQSVLERLKELNRGEPQLICDGHDDDNFGNATATVELDGVRLHIVNDRGIWPVEVGFEIVNPGEPLVHPSLSGFVDEAGKPVCPLEIIAVTLGWVNVEALITHYWPANANQNYEAAPPPGPFLDFNKALECLQEGEHWGELADFSRNHRLQLEAGQVERHLQEHFAAQLETH